VTLTYSYDQLGDETSVTDSLSSQGITTYTFNDAQEMTGISATYGGTSGPQISFNYDNGGRLTSTSRTIGGSGDQVNTTVTYDAANRVVSITDGVYANSGFFFTTTPLATYSYGYDSASRVTTEVDAEGTYTYSYDNANDFTGVTENGTVVGTYS
jgi:YD repeat-containing protein